MGREGIKSEMAKTKGRFLLSADDTEADLIKNGFTKLSETRKAKKLRDLEESN
jgi:hypothetical protein